MAAEPLRFCEAAELPEGAVKSRLLDEVPVAVARYGGRLHAFGALCPHQQADLAEGILEDDGIACGKHLWHFELTTGRCTMVPGMSIPIYRAEERDGAVWVRITGG